eukprot:726229-Hanusia_phi.AAC.2
MSLPLATTGRTRHAAGRPISSQEVQPPPPCRPSTWRFPPSPCPPTVTHRSDTKQELSHGEQICQVLPVERLEHEGGSDQGPGGQGTGLGSKRSVRREKKVSEEGEEGQ